MSSARIRVSVCIATYNQVDYVADCVTSVITQAADVELEIIVGNDASTDGTAQVLDELALRWPGRLQVLHRAPNLGAVENYRDLAQRASGEFIAHLDGDDAWLPGKLQAQLDFLAAHPECPAVYGNGVAVDEAGRWLGPFTNSHPEKLSLPYLCARGNFLFYSTMLYRRAHRDAFLALGGAFIDYGIHLAFAARGALGFVDRPLGLYRVATATSLVRTSFPWVQRQLWLALEPATRALPLRLRREAIAHFVARALLARVMGQASEAWPLVREAAERCGCSSAQLLVRTLPPLLRLLAHGVLCRLLHRLGASGRLAQHYRA